MDDATQTERPSEVRMRVLDEHRRLRKSLLELQALASATADGRVRMSDLRESACALFVQVADHLAAEDEFFLPRVAEVPGNGPQLAERMRTEHDEQRRALRAMVDRTRSENERTLLAELDEFVVRTCRDLAAEEQLALQIEQLRDDVIAIDQFGG